MEVTVSFPGEVIGLGDTDYIADVEVKITSPSRPACGPSYSCGGEPPEGCEFDVVSITLFKDGTRTPIEMSSLLFDLIAESDELYNAVADAEYDYKSGPDPDDAYDAWRDAQIEGN